MVKYLVKRYPSKEQVAEKFYTILLPLWEVHCTKQEIKILSFAAARDNISSVTSRRDCMESLSISAQSLNNAISRLQRIKLFVKESNGKIKVNPTIKIEFDGDLVLGLKLGLDGDKQKTEEGNSSDGPGV